jgi:hypothetical protein
LIYAVESVSVLFHQPLYLDALSSCAFICFILNWLYFHFVPNIFILNMVSTVLKYLISTDCIRFMSLALNVKDSYPQAYSKVVIISILKNFNCVSHLVLVFKVPNKATDFVT